ncbi:MAG: ATP-binding cassette domain-containing protein [Methanomassiliicoccales archaeon]|nr:ATP-binding cassette domain-containing protein [Methanomassiliicoccales archaeon]
MKELRELTILGGIDKNGRREGVNRVLLKRGEIIGIVGPTGSGKSTLLNDVEQLAKGDTISRRTILINGVVADEDVRTNPKKRLVAQLSQRMHFLADLRVGEFLKIHARSRGRREEIVSEVLALANTLCGEPIVETDRLTTLSGGQCRALMTADIAIISDSTVVLVDEIENAGIKKQEALRLLSGKGKIVMVITHDPYIALIPPRRIVMRNGGMISLINRSEEEVRIHSRLIEIDDWICNLRERIRMGEVVCEK